MTQAEADLWAKGSKYADDVFYHGTSKGAADIISKEGFKLKNLGYNKGNGGLHGAGHYVTTNAKYAETYGEKILKIKINAKNVLTDYKKYERLEDIGYNITQATQGTYGMTLKEVKRVIGPGISSYQKEQILKALDFINEKDWKIIKEIISNEKFGIEMVQRYVYQKAGYDAILLGDGVEIVIFNDAGLVIIK